MENLGIFAALGLPLIGKRQSPKSVCLISDKPDLCFFNR